jgi:hypothetical protein
MFKQTNPFKIFFLFHAFIVKLDDERRAISIYQLLIFLLQNIIQYEEPWLEKILNLIHSSCQN